MAWRPSRAWRAVLATIVAAGVLLRVVELGRLPGLNGDEAWYGVQMQRLVSGQPVEWRTPTGNLMGPVQPALLVPLQAAFPPSPGLLRWPAVLSGVAAVALFGLVLGRRFGPAAGWIAAALTASLPAALAYSRFGWDASHSGPPALLALHASLAGSLLGVALLFPLLLWIHPTNVFLAPFLAGAFLGAGRPRWGTRGALARAAALSALLAAGTSILLVTTAGGFAPPFAETAARALSWEAWTSFALHLVRFTTGDVVHAYVAGPDLAPGLQAADLAGGCALAALVAGAAILVRRQGLTAATGMAAGLLLSLATFGVAVGARGLAPHTDRYGLWLLTPLTAVAAVVVAALGRRRPALALATTAGCSALLLIHTLHGYFGELERSGSRSHPTFWTGPREPKAEAVRRVLEAAQGRRPLRILAGDWWTLWPARYLVHPEPAVDVLPLEEGLPPAAEALTYLVAFPGEQVEARLAAQSDARAVRAFDVEGTARPVALRVWRVEPAVER